MIDPNEDYDYSDIVVKPIGPILWPTLRQYPTLKIPETWDTLEEFVDWYMKERKPLCVPWDAEVFVTDDATAMCIFRQGQYQVEMYLIHAGFNVLPHGHPDMEVITVGMGGGGCFGEPLMPYGTSKYLGRTLKIVPGEYHGGGDGTAHGKGFMLLTFEKWLNGVKPTSAAIQWEGPLAGPLHKALHQKKEA